MALSDLTDHAGPVTLLQRSMERGRLGHAYLLTGSDLALLESAAGSLAKTLNCETPPRSSDSGQALDCCETCLNCRKIDTLNHPDVHWIRPESKSRIITIQQMRDLMHTVYLKPTQAAWKVSIVVAADRLNPESANSFLKTLEEPPPASVLIMISTEPERVLDTIVSRCLRLNFAGMESAVRDEGLQSWLAQFSALAAKGSPSLLSRYRVLSLVLDRLTAIKEGLESSLRERSPLQQHEEIDPKLKERWENELAAAIEAEYRHQRRQLLIGLQWWFRDVWLATFALPSAPDGAAFPRLAADARVVAARLSSSEAMQNLLEWEQTQRLLQTNVQEALALEVGMLKLRF